MRLEDRFLRAVRSARQLGAKGFLFALLAFGLALWARYATQGALDSRTAFIFFLPAILTSAMVGGVGPGLLAVVASLAAEIAIIGPPVTVLGTGELIACALVALSIAVLGEIVRYAEISANLAKGVLLERESYIRSIFDTIIDAAVVIDRQGKIISFNRAAVRQFVGEHLEVRIRRRGGEWKELGGYAAIASFPLMRRPSMTATLACRTRCAPIGDQRIWRRLFILRFTRKLAVDSARELETGRPAHERSA